VRSLPVGDLPDDRPTPTVDLAVPHVALAVGAHPDDIEFGCGATLAKWAAAGCRVHHLVLTDGSKGTWDSSVDSGGLTKVRKQEQQEAAAILGGGDVTFLDVVDGDLDSGEDTRRRVCEVIRRVRPDVLLGHDPWRRYRLHPDHRHAGWLVTDGLVAARDHKFFPSSGEAHRPTHLLLFEPDVPNHVENVAGHVDKKIAALLAHRSQHVSTMGIGAAGATGPGSENDTYQSEADAFAEQVRAQLASHGMLAGLDSAEAFHRMDDI
jgi:LmbE family N-acetylglucosaminyl deacetylase